MHRERGEGERRSDGEGKDLVISNCLSACLSISQPAILRHRAAAIGPLGLLVEELALAGQLPAPLHEIFELLPTLQYRLYGVVKHVPSVVQVALYAHYLVGVGRVLDTNNIQPASQPAGQPVS